MNKILIWFLGSALVTSGYCRSSNNRSSNNEQDLVPPKPLDVLKFGKTGGTYLMKMQEWKGDGQTCYTRKLIRAVESSKDDEVCNSQHIMTNYCYGTCNSLYIPQPNNQAFKLCKACTPMQGKIKETVVFLKCRKRKKNGRLGQKTVQLVTVQQIESCGCSKVDCNK